MTKAAASAETSRVIKLSEPIKQGSETIHELQIRKPKAKDIRSLPVDPSTGDLLDLGGRLTGQPPSVIDELCMEDTATLLAIVGNFFERGQRTGSKV